MNFLEEVQEVLSIAKVIILGFASSLLGYGISGNVQAACMWSSIAMIVAIAIFTLIDVGDLYWGSGRKEESENE